MKRSIILLVVCCLFAVIGSGCSYTPKNEGMPEDYYRLQPTAPTHDGPQVEDHSTPAHPETDYDPAEEETSDDEKPSVEDEESHIFSFLRDWFKKFYYV